MFFFLFVCGAKSLYKMQRCNWIVIAVPRGEQWGTFKYSYQFF